MWDFLRMGWEGERGWDGCAVQGQHWLFLEGENQDYVGHIVGWSSSLDCQFMGEGHVCLDCMQWVLCQCRVSGVLP